MKYWLLSLFLVFHYSCKEEHKPNEFSYEQAIKDLQKEIQELDDNSRKERLLWQIDRILKKDTLYKNKLNPNSFDSLTYDIAWEKYEEYVYQQLELHDLSKLSLDDSIEAYKFTYHRSFSREVVIISISNQDNTFPTLKAQIYVEDYQCNPIVGTKKFNGSCFKIKLNDSRRLLSSEWLEFKDLIAEKQYWTIPENDTNDGTDGSDWVIEGTRPVSDSADSSRQVYKKVYRWSPEPHSPVFEIGLYLLHKNKYVYGRIY